MAAVKKFGKLTPFALVATFLPVLGSAVLIPLAKPLGDWLRGAEEIGVIAFFAGTLIFCGLALLPTNVLGILSGWAFGFWLGTAVLMAGIVAAATVSFLIYSRLIGETLPQVFEKNPKARAVYRALVSQNFWRTTILIFLLRLSPAMPFALTNFLMSSARVPLVAYMAGTFLGMLPRSAAVVLVGSQLSELSFEEPQEIRLLIFGIAATIVSIVFIGSIAKKALANLIDENESAAPN